MKAKKFLLLLIFLVGIAQIIPIRSPYSYAQQNSSSVREVQTQTFSGRVIKLDNNTITITTDNGIKQLLVPQKIRVTRNNIGTALNDIRLNDQIEVTQSAAGDILAIDALPGNAIDWSRWSISFAILGFLIILGTVISKQKNQKKYLPPRALSGMGEHY